MKKILIILLIGFFPVIFSCRQEAGKNIVIKTVKTDTVKVYGENKSVAFPGKVVSASEINLAFRISGPVSKIHVDAGRYIHKGQLLAEIDSRDYTVQLAATEAEYNRIKSEADRIIALYSKGSVTPNDYDKAVYGLNQISAKYEAHKNALSDTKLYAPCDGYVQKRIFEAGETVNAGLPVLSMITAGTDEVEINIPSSDYIRRDNFAGYYCTVDIYPEEVFPLEPVGITRKANMNQLYTMRLRLTGNGRNKPGPGMSVMVTILYKTEDTETVSIPVTSIFKSDSKTTVWIYDKSNETVSSRRIEIAQILRNGTVVVSSGLLSGEIIVSAGINSVKEGEKVKALPAIPETNVGKLL